MKRAWLLLAVACAACDQDPPRIWPYDAGVTDGGSSSTDGGTNGQVLRAAGITGVHVASCSDDTLCGAGGNPPLGGNHCPTWLACRKYDMAQPRCSWLHNLEHGHAVLAYNCPNGCADLVQKLNGLFDSLQSNPTRRRILVTPDPKLPRKVAAIVWGFGWMGDAYDEAAIQEVLSHQDAEAPEANLGCSQ